MSVINSMLRDLDRRHAPLPVNTTVQLAPAQSNRVVLRFAIALGALLIVAIIGWKLFVKVNAPVNELINSVPMESSEPANRRSADSFATTRHTFSEIKSIHGGSEAASVPPTVAANESANQLASAPAASIENKNSVVSSVDKKIETEMVAEKNSKEKIQQQAEIHSAAPIIKQEHTAPEDLNSERYQLARAALAQNQPERAYELLRDSPPALASNGDYHAVLAAIEQQTGRYADASVRYQQLLMLDQNQASWWLGLALSLDGQRRNNDALAAYQRAVALNALPDAARQYALARIAALTHFAEH